MKTILKPLTCLLIAGTIFLTGSCKKDQPENVVVPESAVETDTVMPIPDTTYADVKTDANGSNATMAEIDKSAVSNPPNGVKKGKNQKSIKGYSAPDGTDAENNDGDQYTKNDNTRMPSGGNSMK